MIEIKEVYTLLEIFLIFTGAFIIAFSGAVAPGPLLAVTISETVKRGFMAGPSLILGHGVLEIALIAVIMMGGDSILTLPAVSDMLKLIGGIVLLVMAWTIIRGLKHMELDLTAQSNANVAVGSTAIKGVVASTSNPYWIIWWATIGLGYLTIALQKGFMGIAAFFSGHILADLAWYSFISYMISAGRSRFDTRVYRGILLICGIFLLFLGITFIYMSVA